VKTLNEKFTEEEFAELLKAKDGKSWHDFILGKCLVKKDKLESFDFDIGGEEPQLW
jgi:hypothetical protein